MIPSKKVLYIVIKSHLEISIKVIYCLRQDADPVDAVDGSQVVLSLERNIVEYLFDLGLTIVECSRHYRMS